MEGGLCELLKSPNISHGAWGKPAPTEVRSVTDHSWDFGLSITFADMAAHERYQQGDAVHDAFSDGLKEMWEKVLVMDLALA